MDLTAAATMVATEWAIVPDSYPNSEAEARRSEPGSINELTGRVEKALCATGYPALRKIGVSQRGSAVILAGAVPRYYFKQVAQSVALAVPGVAELQNDIETLPTA